MKKWLALLSIVLACSAAWAGSGGFQSPMGGESGFSSQSRSWGDSGGFVNGAAGVSGAATPTPTPVVQFVNVGTTTQVHDVTMSVAAPASINTNYAIIVQFDYFDTGTTITAPDGSWHKVRTDDSGTSGQQQQIWWHLATGSGDGPWTFTFSSAFMQATASAWKNNNITTPVEAGGGTNSGNTCNTCTNLTSTSVTPTTSGGMLVAFWGYWHPNGASQITIDAGLTGVLNAYLGTPTQINQLQGYVAAPNSGVASGTFTNTINNAAGLSSVVTSVVVIDHG